MFGPCYFVIYLGSFLVYNHLAGEENYVCFTLIAL